MEKNRVCGAVLALLCVSLVSVNCEEGARKKGEEKEGGGKTSKVMELTQENWDQVINNTPLIMVEFYANW